MSSSSLEHNNKASFTFNVIIVKDMCASDYRTDLIKYKCWILAMDDYLKFFLAVAKIIFFVLKL